MPYNENTDSRIREVISAWKNIESKRMFGGVCHLLKGNMFCGVYKDYLILRIGEEESRRALESGEARPFDITGKPMKGWVMVEEGEYAGEKKLAEWIARAKNFADSLPAKTESSRMKTVKKHGKKS